MEKNLISYGMMNVAFVENRFPELQKRIDAMKVSWGEEPIPPHCLFGDVFDAYLVSLLKENKEQKQIRKIFDFYEELAEFGDAEVRNLLQVTLLEYLWDDAVVYWNARSYMGEKTLLINQEIGAYLTESTKPPKSSPWEKAKRKKAKGFHQ
jgi:hypothetical protein